MFLNLGIQLSQVVKLNHVYTFIMVGNSGVFSHL